MEIHDFVSAASRKERLGRAASYRKIAKRAGYSVSTVYDVMNNRPGGPDYDRETVMRRCIAAIEAIENEVAADAA